MQFWPDALLTPFTNARENRTQASLDESLRLKSLSKPCCFDTEINKFVRPRWPYDMRPSARAEKYMCVIVIR